MALLEARALTRSQPVQIAAVRELVIGASLILVLRFRPAGILPERLPRMSIPAPESG